MKCPDNLKDIGVERALLGTVIKYGRDTYIDVSDILSSQDFTLPINQKIYKCIDVLSEDISCSSFDPESIITKAKILGIGDVFDSESSKEYLDVIATSVFDKERARHFAFQVRKLSIARGLYDQCEDTKKYLEEISGSESLAEIIQESEDRITSFLTGASDQNSLRQIGDGLSDKIMEMMKSPPVDQIGIPTGYNNWDRAIGGGLRKGTVNVIGARPKQGKSWDALNKAANIANRGIPVLYLDSEMTLDDQQFRILAIESGYPISALEKGNFGKDIETTTKILETSEKVSSENFPLTYESIAGKSFAETMNLVRRWIVKNVGFNDDGSANDCVVIYDYLKLTSDEGLSKHSPEYLLIGLMITKMANLAIKYGFPFLTYIQLNRDGIGSEDTSVIAGSDRILWLCSNFSILKNKDQTDIDLGCGYEFGNKKVFIVETRHGPGLGTDDYINIDAHIRPGVPDGEATGKMKETILFSQRETLGTIYGKNQSDNN